MAHHALLSRIGELAESLQQWRPFHGGGLPCSSASSSQQPPSDQSSHNLNEIRDDLAALQRMVRRIQAVLVDAEEREIQDESVKLWLRELKSLAYNADDVLDEYEYERLRAKVETDNAQAEDEYQEQLSTPNPSDVSFWGNIADKITEIRGRFEEISKQRDALRLRKRDAKRRRPHRTAVRPPSTQFPDASTLHGRKDDLEQVINRLLRSDECKQHDLSVLPIVGMGGVGKTTLLQHVYKDHRVCEHFELKGWVCVSDDFSVENLTRTIIESLTGGVSGLTEFSTLQKELVEILQGKRFLLVLDDVWNEKPCSWDDLKKPLVCGLQGSTVVTTTRSEFVARIMQTMPFHRMNCLSDEDCWLIFQQNAFPTGQHPNNYEDLVGIGKEIAKKCKGLPLAAKVVGGLLRNQSSYDRWEDILQSQLWDIVDQRNGISPAIRLSYLHLPSHLKACFLYAAVFPKDFEFEKEQLVQLWMAHGFLKCNSRREAEDIGNTYFDDLVERCLFQPSYDRWFVMHDLIHDLAQSVSAGESSVVLVKQDDNVELVDCLCPEGVRHLYLCCQLSKHLKSMTLSISHGAASSVRTLVIRREAFNFKIIANLRDFGSPRCLRALDVRKCRIGRLLDSLGNLIHLRYLNLKCTYIETLPKSICRLYQLQVLNLCGCRLRSLPEDIQGLCNLRHLDIRYNDIDSYPKGFSKLTNLRTLRGFDIPEGASEGTLRGFGIPEGASEGGFVMELLREMAHLRGLEIWGLGRVTNAKDAEMADLRNKKNIQQLWLSFDRERNDASSIQNQIQVLESLQPHRGLISLAIRFFTGCRLPNWMADDPSTFSKLKYLELSFMENVERALGRVLGWLPALEELKIRSLNNWVTWGEADHPERGGEFPRLRKLDISGCLKLQSVPLYTMSALEDFCISNADNLESIELMKRWSGADPPPPPPPTMSSSSSSPSTSSSCNYFWGPPPLKMMTIRRCPDARFSPVEEDELLQQPLLSPTLRDLTIRDCRWLSKWCESDGRRRLAHLPHLQYSQ